MTGFGLGFASLFFDSLAIDRIHFKGEAVRPKKEPLRPSLAVFFGSLAIDRSDTFQR